MQNWHSNEATLASLSTCIFDFIPNFGTITSVKILEGGYSNLTFSLTTNKGQFVLRQPPPGAQHIKGGHNMEREFTILQKLWRADFKLIPEVLHFSSNTELIGSEFYIMRFIEGEVLRASNFKSYLENLNPNKMKALSKKLCFAQAQLHKIDITETGLIAIGKPSGYIQRQVKGWHDRYLASQTHEIADFNTVSAWLHSNMPEEISPTLLHNDFKFDNVVLDHSLSEIQAILDWEMCTVGDPRMDIGTTLSYWCEEGDDAFEKNFNTSWLPGCLTRMEYVALYQQHNPEMDLSNILYFYVFGLFKNAIVIQQIFSRYHKGLTQDPRFKHLDKGVARLLSKAQESISQNKMH
jgi:aminoglycoside phosphotransferase (APT) family kinase protein